MSEEQLAHNRFRLDPHSVSRSMSLITFILLTIILRKAQTEVTYFHTKYWGYLLKEQPSPLCFENEEHLGNSNFVRKMKVAFSFT